MLLGKKNVHSEDKNECVFLLSRTSLCCYPSVLYFFSPRCCRYLKLPEVTFFLVVLTQNACTCCTVAAPFGVMTACSLFGKAHSGPFWMEILTPKRFCFFHLLSGSCASSGNHSLNHEQQNWAWCSRGDKTSASFSNNLLYSLLLFKGGFSDMLEAHFALITHPPILLFSTFSFPTFFFLFLYSGDSF